MSVRLRRKPQQEPLDWAALKRSRYGLAPLVILGSYALIQGLVSEFSLIAGPNIAQDLNLDIRTIGGIIATVGTISIGGTLFLGWLSDRTKRVRMLGISVILQGLFGAAVSGTTNGAGFASVSVGSRVAGLGSQVARRPLLADYYPPHQRGRVFGLVGSLDEGTQLLSLLVVGVLVTAVGWRSANVILTLPIILSGLVMLIFLREPIRGFYEKRAVGFDEETSAREDQPQSFGEAWRTVFAVRMLRRFFIAYMFAQIAFGPDRFLPFFLADEYGLDALQRSLLAIPTTVALFVGGVFGGYMLDALSSRSPSSMLRTYGALSVSPIVGFVVYAIQPHILIIALGMTFNSLALGAFIPSFQAVLSQIIPAKVRGQGLTVLSLASIPGNIALGLVFGSVISVYGFRAGWLLAIPFLLVMGILMVSVADFYEVDRRNALLASATDEEVRRAQAEGRTKLLLCRGVNVFYESNQVLFGVDFEVDEGEVVALLGTNGAGKSTLLRAISGSQEASDGAIVVDGRDITHMPPHEIVRRGVIHMPGGRGIFPGLSVEENLTLATWNAGAQHEKKLLAEAYALFPILSERRTQRAGLLSGGEQQMLSLAQAFMSKPKLLMIDELTLGLAPAVVADLIRLVQEINKRGTTVIVVEQSVNVALTIAQRAVFMEKGEVKFVGKTADLLRRPDILRSVYVRGTAARSSGRRPVATDERVVLEVKGVVKRFGGVNALNGVDLTLRDGQTLGLIGPNGSGKTTLFDIISGYQLPDEGTVTFDGTDITALSASERARRGLVRRFQDARLFPALTVTESLLVALDQGLEQKNLAFATARLPAMRRDERRARQRAENLIELLDLGAYRDKFVKELSTGLRRIVDIAWVLATEPKVLLLDEPSSGVAQAEAESLVPLLRRVGAETGCSILIVEHDIPLVSAVSDELIAMAAGEVVTRGPADDVLDDDRVIEAFLGTSEAAVRRSGALR